jgi:cell division protein FtsX
MNVVIGWLRLELPRRWRSLAVLALLIAVASGTVMTALAGARRNASAVDRFEARTRPATAAILPNTRGFDWSKVRALPQVDAFTTFGPTFTIEGLPPDAEAEPLLDPAAMSTIERPVVFSGRMLDPSRSDEGFVSPKFVSRYHKGVGDTVVVMLPTPAELQAAVASGSPDRFTGPRLNVRIVGVGIDRWYGDELVLSPGVVSRYAANILGSSRDRDRPLLANALVRLKGGTPAIPQLRADVTRVTSRSDLEVLDLAEWVDRPVRQQATFEARCLVALAAAAFAAAAFLVGQAIARYVTASTGELQTLRALGMRPRQAIAAATAGPVCAGVLGGALGVVGAIVASRWFPIGAAAEAEPAPGTSADWVVLGPGLAVAAALAAGSAVVAAWLALTAGRRAVTPRRSTVAAAVAWSGLPVPVVVGTRFALEAGRGRTAAPVRPALIGAVTGVLGVLAAFTFSSGVSDAASHPERFGQTFQLSAFVGADGQDFEPTSKAVRALRAADDVEGVDDARVGVATGPAGSGSVSLYTYSEGAKPVDVAVTSGRIPRSADEVLLAPQSIKTLHVRVGDRVALSGSRATSTFTVTGTGLVPAGAHNTYADGGWVTDAGYDTLFSGFKFHLVYVALRPDARTADAAATLTATVAKSDPSLADFSFDPPDELAQVKALRDVRALPIVLGIFLALLAVGAVGHALATAVRRRSRDIAVLRALGMTKQQCRWVVVTQATVLAAVGLVFGVPIGLVVGRSVWRAVADYTPFQYVAPVAAWALVLLGPGALMVANVLAAWPGRRAARLRIAQILRAE